jgi:DNA-directed RNA polymerase alpha subunit
MRPENRIRKVIKPDPDAGVDPHELLLRKPIAEMPMSVRVINMLEEYDILTVGDLLKQSYQSLVAIKNFGETTMREVTAALVALQLPVPSWKPPKAPKKRVRRQATDFIGLYG